MSERLNNFPVRGTVYRTRPELIALAPNLERGFHNLLCRRRLFNRAVTLSTAGFECGHNSDAQDETEGQGILFRFQKLHHDFFLSCVTEISFIPSCT